MKVGLHVSIDIVTRYRLQGPGIEPYTTKKYHQLIFQLTLFMQIQVPARSKARVCG